MKTTVQFSDQELATVLAALRYYQANSALVSPDLKDIATNGDSFEALSDEKIDELCEEINTSGPLKIIVEVSGGVVDPVHVSHEADVTVYDHDNIEAGDEPPLDLEKESSELPHTY